MYTFRCKTCGHYEESTDKENIKKWRKTHKKEKCKYKTVKNEKYSYLIREQLKE